MTPKAKNLLTAALAATLSVGFPAGRAVAKDATGKRAKVELPQLQLSVDVPPNWRPFLSDDLAEAFASRVSDVFRRRGFSGAIKFLDHDDPSPDLPALSIRLITWRIGRTDNAECTFTANVTIGGQEHLLGVFEHTSLLWNKGQGRWGLADALGDVADGALRDLAIRLDQAGLVTGFLVGKK